MVKVTIGQYYPTASFIHKLDSRMKLACTMIFIVVVFFITNFLGYALAAGYLFLIVRTSKVPPKFLLRGLSAIFFIIIFTAVLNIFFTAGPTTLFEYGRVRISAEGLINAVRMAFRLAMLVIGSSVLTLTTTPTQLTDAIEFYLKPFKKIGVPAHEIAMMMTIALRMIPSLMEEMDKIMKAQMARGADFDTGGIIKKAKSLVPLLVPLFISSFRRAEELALAMESRCYRGDIGRTRMKIMRLARRDYFCFGFVAAFTGMIFVLNYVAGILGVW